MKGEGGRGREGSKGRVRRSRGEEKGRVEGERNERGEREGKILIFFKKTVQVGQAVSVQRTVALPLGILKIK